MTKGSQKRYGMSHLEPITRNLDILSNNMPPRNELGKCFIKFSNNVLSHSICIIKTVASLSLYNPWSILNRNYNYVCPKYGASMDESCVFTMWYNSISDVERADVNLLDDVISVRNAYKQCDLSIDEIPLPIELS